MEARKITVVTKNQGKKVIMSSATTLGELKADLSREGISYEDMTFFEGTAKVELLDDSSTLPHDVPYKGTVTNELVFLLTSPNKKIKSGAMSRMEAYDEIRKRNLQDICLKKLGKNFTMCKTADLIKLIEENKCDSPKEEEKKDQPSYSWKEGVVVPPVTPKESLEKPSGIPLEDLFNNLLDVLVEKGVVEGSDIAYILNKKKNSQESSSPYSDEELHEMFSSMNLVD